MTSPKTPASIEPIAVRFKVGVVTSGARVVHIRIVAVLNANNRPSHTWMKWWFQENAVYFVNATGGRNRVRCERFTDASIKALHLICEVMTSKMSVAPSALLWSALLEHVAALVSIDAEEGGEFDLKRLSAALLATAKQGGAFS